MENIQVAMLLTRKDLRPVCSVCCGAVRGAALRGAYDLRIATGTSLGAAASTSVFALPGTFSYTLHFHPFRHFHIPDF
jgi:hypothetical protein